MKLKVSQKGFFFIAAPLIVLFIVIGLLRTELESYEQDYQRQTRAREIVEFCDELSGCFDEAVSSVTQFALTNRPIYADNYQKSVLRAQSVLKELSEIKDLEPEQASSVEAVTTKVKEGVTLLESLGTNISKTDEARTEILRGHLLTQFKAIQTGVEKQLAKLRSAEKRRAEDAGANHNATGQHLKLIADFGLGASIFIAIILSIWFSKSITKKLEVMRENTLRFASNQSPHPEIGGHDEFAELDRAFHAMTDLIKEAQQKERALVNNSSEIICSIQKQGALSEVNPAVHEVWGYEPEELLGRKAIDIIQEDERDRFWKFLDSCTTSDTAQKLETAVIDKHGESKDALFSCTWSNDQSSWYCVVSDISDRKQLERMKKDFVAMISHDLRAPLASIRMMLEMIADGIYGELSEVGKTKVSRTDTSIQRLLSLLDQLLEVEKMEAGKVELELSQEDIDDLADNAAKEVAALAEVKNVVIEVTRAGVRATVDRDRLIRVIVNLLSNAIKYSPSAGTIEVAVLDLDDDFEIQVIDEGIGIPKEYQDTVFERYEQVKEKSHRVKGGTGLGLAICKMIVEAHGGQIGVTSEGKGSTFWFRMPKNV